jgi:hypothetical protein
MYMQTERNASVARENLFTMRVDQKEREQLAILARRQQRPVADVIRALVRRALQEDDRAAARTEALSVSRV